MPISEAVLYLIMSIEDVPDTSLPSGERHTRERTCKNSSGSVLRQQQGRI